MTAVPGGRSLVHIGDIIHAFDLKAPVDAIHNQAFNVDENYRIRQVAELVAQTVPGSEVTFAAGASGDARDYRVDFSKIQRHLPGYKPTWALKKGIERALHGRHGRQARQGDLAGPALLPA